MKDKLNKVKVVLTTAVLFVWLWALLFVILVCFMMSAMSSDQNKFVKSCVTWLNKECVRLELKLGKWLDTNES